MSGGPPRVFVQFSSRSFQCAESDYKIHENNNNRFERRRRRINPNQTLQKT